MKLFKYPVTVFLNQDTVVIYNRKFSQYTSPMNEGAERFFLTIPQFEMDADLGMLQATGPLLIIRAPFHQLACCIANDSSFRDKLVLPLTPDR
jgi:hypothetical protein